MKRTTRLSALLMAGVLSVSTLAGCSQQASSSTAASAVSESATPTEAPTAAEEPAATETPSNSESSDAMTETNGDATETDSNVLVVYYSATGNTASVAQTIAEVTGGDLFEITPSEPYTSEDLDWTNENSRVSQEYADESLRDVDLTTVTPENWDSYDTVFIGYPIWWGIAAWPTSSFVTANDFTGKTVIPFCTSSSSGLGESGSLLAEAAGTGDWLEGERFRSSASTDDVTEWVNGLGL